MSQDEYFISVGGFVIRVYLTQTEWSIKRNLFRDLLQTNLYEFNTSKTDADFTLIVTNHEGIPSVKTGVSHYMLSYRFLSHKQIETYYHIGLLQLYQILWIIVLKLLGKKGFILHASAVLTKNGALLFLGPSGAGKSTIAHILASSFQPLADDSMIIRLMANTLYCFQTPTIDKVDIQHKSMKPYPIHSIFALHKNKPIMIKQIHKELSFKILAESMWKTDVNQPISSRIALRVAQQIPFYYLSYQLHEADKLAALLL